MSSLSPTARILDLDGSVTAQKKLMAALSPGPDVLDLRRLGPAVRYLASRRGMAALEASLRPQDRLRLTFIGSGDFHHVTAALLRRFREPLSLVVFDRHPDWDRTSPWACCGSWVLEALRLPYVKKIVVVGLGREDIEGWRINVGRPGLLRSERVAFYPYDCPRSVTLSPLRGHAHCADFRPRFGRTDIRWNRIRDGDWDRLLGEILDGLPTDDVYLSIDKDCLTESSAVTNWEAGHLPLAQLLRGIETVNARKNVIGADVTGEYSPVDVHNPLFRILSKWDHPKRPSPTPEDLERNERTNLLLIGALGFHIDRIHT